MADKVIILKVDLSCSMCSRKMRQVLDQRHQDEWNIKKVNWDDKNNQITLSGPFDPDVLIKKLCCRACKTIKGINTQTSPQQLSTDTSTPSTPAPPVEQPAQQTNLPVPTAPPWPVPSDMSLQPLMLNMTGQICFCGPCHEQQRSCNCDCRHGHRPCVCHHYGGAGYGYGWNNMPPPPVYGNPTCQFFFEEDPGSCTVM